MIQILISRAESRLSQTQAQKPQKNTQPIAFTDRRQTMRNRGFTLIELSVVIVIIELIVASIVAGQSLVKQAQIRNAVADAQKYQTAAQAFRLQYGYLPGDLPNAYDYWGAGAGNCTDALATAGGTGCNGNGDTWWDDEGEHFWQHLSLAGIWENNLTGVREAGSRVRADIDNPRFYKEGNIANPVLSIGAMGFTNVMLGVATRNDLSSQNVGIWTPATNQLVDNKIDDGVANSGKSIGISGAMAVSPFSAQTCHTAGVYEVATEAPACMPEWYF